MKFICKKSDFETALTKVIPAVPSRPTHPILSNVLVDVKNSNVGLTAFDLGLGIRSLFYAQTIKEGTFTLPAKLLKDILSKLPDGEMSLEVGNIEDESFLTTITAQSGKFQIRGITADEFPSLPSVESLSFSIPSDTLSKALSSVSSFAANDETKMVLTGIRLTKTLDSLESAATDGHRLGCTNVELNDDTEFAFTLPARSAKEVEKLIDKTEECFLKVEESLACFSVENQMLITRLCDGNYPNYQQLIPKTFEGECVVNRKDFIKAVELVSVVSDQKNNLCHITFDPAEGTITLVTQAADIGSASQLLYGEMKCDAPITIGFNIKYLLEGLKNITSTDIKINWNQPNSPVTINPLGELNHVYLIMPVQIVR